MSSLREVQFGDFTVQHYKCTGYPPLLMVLKKYTSKLRDSKRQHNSPETAEKSWDTLQATCTYVQCKHSKTQVYVLCRLLLNPPRSLHMAGHQVSQCILCVTCLVCLDCLSFLHISSMLSICISMHLYTYMYVHYVYKYAQATHGKLSTC